MTRLKICGLRETDHAIVAAEEGADYLGFNFVPGVRRQITVEHARAIINEYRRERGDGGPPLVGLFADQPLDDVNHIIRFCGLDLAQLCGDESAEYWEGVLAPVIKQVKVRERGRRLDAVRETTRRVEEVVALGQTAMLDRHEAGALGGTGRTFDWSIAAEVAGRYDFLLAGGLTPDNVGRAIATVGPWGVDVSSGVETGGVKDPAKIRAFAEQVKGADAQEGNLDRKGR